MFCILWVWQQNHRAPVKPDSVFGSQRCPVSLQLMLLDPCLRDQKCSVVFSIKCITLISLFAQLMILPQDEIHLPGKCRTSAKRQEMQARDVNSTILDDLLKREKHLVHKCCAPAGGNWIQHPYGSNPGGCFICLCERGSIESSREIPAEGMNWLFTSFSCLWRKEGGTGL